MATADYCDLSIEKGTVIHATRAYKALTFKEILEQHQILNPDRYRNRGRFNRFKSSVWSLISTIAVIALAVVLLKGCAPWFEAFTTTVK